VVARLRAAVGDGRLTLDEMEERVGAVYRARTASDLVPLTADLPAPAPAAGAVRATNRGVGVLSGAKQKGHWRPAAVTDAVAVVGSCRLDLCDAILDDPEIHIRATAVLGSVEVLVPEGVHVDLGGFAVLGSKTYRVRSSTPTPGAPSIHVDARAFAGSVTVRTKAFNGRRR
jgi:hypothetical protein